MTPLAQLRHARGLLLAGLPEKKVLENLWRWLESSYLNVEAPRQIAFARSVGIKVAPMIENLIAHERFIESTRSEISIALQGPKFTARLIHWLPWLALLGSQLLGLNPIAVLLEPPFGWALLAVAVGLGMAAGRVTRKILAKAAVPVADSGLEYRLLASALNSGVGLQRSFAALDSLSVGPLTELAAFCRQALNGGLCLADQLLAKSLELQEQVVEAKRLGLQKLPIELLAPLGLFLLPQFLILLVFPQALAVFAGLTK